MDLTNETFLEEYKRLDKLCRDLYKNNTGITSYIEDMKNTSSIKSICIPNWDSDLHSLIRLRHIRNQLSHEVGTLNICMCTQTDIDWLRSFYSRILATSNPISLLKKNLTAMKQPIAKAQPAISMPQAPLPSETPVDWLIILLLLLCIIIISYIIWTIVNP